MAPKKSKQKSKSKSKAAGSANKAKPKKPAGKARAKRSQPPVRKAIRRSARRLLKGAASSLQRAGSPTAAPLGEVEGISRQETADSESVAQLIEEGQDFEAELVDAIENAPDPDEAELDAEPPEEDDPVSDPRKSRNRF
jgi:hypothetical protein